MSKQLQIRNSTAEFLIFQAEDKAQGVQVFYKDETIWATQKAMATLFDCSTDNIGVHLKNIFESGELDKDSVTEKISATAADGKNYLTQFYKLDAIISAEQAKEYAETEFEKYRVIQDRLFESDFDKFDLPTLPFDKQE
ncbi:MAG: phosphoribosylaminoimidazolesuccinocarboxamide synthase [Paludibacteraceae bacterium]|nr:phosphoribosylaminoimidazolesuccinocarboxamide synthase [Paludibacteraceae bacterium]